MSIGTYSGKNSSAKKNIGQAINATDPFSVPIRPNFIYRAYRLNWRSASIMASHCYLKHYHHRIDSVNSIYLLLLPLNFDLLCVCVFLLLMVDCSLVFHLGNFCNKANTPNHWSMLSIQICLVSSLGSLKSRSKPLKIDFYHHYLFGYLLKARTHWGRRKMVAKKTSPHNRDNQTNGNADSFKCR